MNIVVRGRNVSITERVQEYVEKKVGKLERYLPIIDEARMELSQEETRSAQHRMIAQSDRAQPRQNPAGRRARSGFVCRHRSGRREDAAPDHALQRSPV